jgi:hypothetical protein
VTDANIWIDVHNADLLDAVSALPFTWRTPDIVLRNEVRTVDRALLVELGLEERMLSGLELNRILKLNVRYPNPSPRDLAVLVVADVDDGMVVTGDGPLRKTAEAEGQTVHGVLWVLDQLVEGEIITKARARAALNAMIDQGSRLPASPVQKRRRKWQTDGVHAFRHLCEPKLLHGHRNADGHALFHQSAGSRLKCPEGELQGADVQL